MNPSGGSSPPLAIPLIRVPEMKSKSSCGDGGYGVVMVFDVVVVIVVGVVVVVMGFDVVMVVEGFHMVV